MTAALYWLALLGVSPEPVAPYDIKRFPAEHIVTLQLRAYERSAEDIAKRLVLEPTRYDLQYLANQNAKCREVWQTLYEATAPRSDRSRVQLLIQLRKQLGPDAYQAGIVPWFPREFEPVPPPLHMTKGE